MKNGRFNVKIDVLTKLKNLIKFRSDKTDVLSL